MAGYPISTKEYGTLNFVHIYSGTSNKEAGAKGGSIGVLDNGAWLHYPSGHPISLEEGKRILNEVNRTKVHEFEAWHENKEADILQQDIEAPRPIRVCPDDILRFEDGDQEEVTTAAAVFAYFKPGSMAQETALRLFTKRQDAREKETAKEILGKERGSTNLDQAFGRSRAARAQPATDPVDKDTMKRKRMENLEKARAAKKRKEELRKHFTPKSEKEKEEELTNA